MDLVEQAEAREVAARACFTANDKDGSGTIDAAELAAVLTTLGLRNRLDGISDDDFNTVVSATLQQHDANADGVLQFKEFVKLYNAVCLAGASPDAAAEAQAALLQSLDDNTRGFCVATLSGHSHYVNAVAVAPDGKTL
eukprot:CAMPEP_0197580576 /NCGR_PEP_ID=MMETSP1326-20131121/4341_1 /TAXON_ID=1155430 /ORGANISM="Genus nov. species nov., Strain RCC2288" /LENGTH=138 /DNA_ID=CAMNT_0043144351 /DNA_START=147 /DNA_END=559 /DNA_ORIENTATION=-